MEKNRTNSEFGVDGPEVIRGLWLTGLGTLIATILPRYLLQTQFPRLTLLGVWVGLAFALLCFLFALLMWRSSRVGKFVERDAMISAFKLQGNEKILDVGCGRGAFTLAAARQLPRGRAYGIDLYLVRDLTGNAQIKAQENARAAGLTDRVDFRVGDMRQLPFEDNMFDGVMSALAIHNLEDRADRRRALSEMLRVTKPGGTLMILDFWNTAEYSETLTEIGAKEVQRFGPRLHLFPFAFLVRAKKPLPILL